MNAGTYGVLAYAARYWFALLALVIVWRAARSVIADNRAEGLRRSEERLRGCVGEMVLIKDEGKRGKKQPERFAVPAEALLGSGRSADIRLKGPGIRKKHLFLTYRQGEMVIHPVNDAPFDAQKAQDGTYVLRDGGRLTVGGKLLTMVFFAVNDAARKASEKDPFDNIWGS